MIAGVLVGEGVYGLRVVRETTSTAYRAGSILGGLLVLAIAVERGLICGRRPLMLTASGTAAVALVMVVAS